MLHQRWWGLRCRGSDLSRRGHGTQRATHCGSEACGHSDVVLPRRRKFFGGFRLDKTRLEALVNKRMTTRARRASSRVAKIRSRPPPPFLGFNFLSSGIRMITHFFDGLHTLPGTVWYVHDIITLDVDYRHLFSTLVVFDSFLHLFLCMNCFYWNICEICVFERPCGLMMWKLGSGCCGLCILNCG